MKDTEKRAIDILKLLVNLSHSCYELIEHWESTGRDLSEVEREFKAQAEAAVISLKDHYDQHSSENNGLPPEGS